MHGWTRQDGVPIAGTKAQHLASVVERIRKQAHELECDPRNLPQTDGGAPQVRGSVPAHNLVPVVESIRNVAGVLVLGKMADINHASCCCPEEGTLGAAAGYVPGGADSMTGAVEEKGHAAGVRGKSSKILDGSVG